MNLHRIISAWLNWRAKRSADRVIAEAERRRRAVAAKIAARKLKHAERSSLYPVLRAETNKSLAASAGRRG